MYHVLCCCCCCCCMYCEASAVSGSRALPLSGAASRLSEPAVGEQAAAHVRGAKNKLQLT